MSKPPRTEPSRELLHELARLISHSAQERARLAAEHQSRRESAAAAFAEAQARARELAEHELARIDARAQLSVRRLAERLERELTAARTRRDRELSRFQAETSEIQRKSAEASEEARWLAETVGETSFRQTMQVHAAGTKAVAASTACLQAAESRAADLRSRGTSRQDLTPPPLTALPPGELRDSIERTLVEAAAAVVHLEGVTRPFFARAEGIATLIALGLLAGAAASLAVRLPPTIASLGIGAGAGLAAGLIASAAFRFWSAQRIAPASQALAQSIARARTLLARQQLELDRFRDSSIVEIRTRKERELRAAAAAAAVAADRLQRRRTADEPALRQLLDRSVAEAKERLADSLHKAEQTIARRRARIESARDQSVQTAAGARDAALAESDSTFASQTAHLRESWQADGSRLLQRADRLSADSAADGPDWPALLDLPARRPDQAGDLIRFGWLDVDAPALPAGPQDEPAFDLGRTGSLHTPASLDLRGVGSLLLHSTPASRPVALAALQAVMLRLLTQLPPGKVRFIIFDPVGLGQSFAGFMHLSDYEPIIVGDRIWTETRHFEQKLTDLTEHMEQVIQKYLRNQFQSIQDYNRDAGEIAEPFRFLIIADFPANFSEAAAKRLASVVSSGPRCGVFTLITTDTRTRPGSWVQMSDVERASIVLDFKDNRYVVRDPEMGRWPLTLESPPDEELFRKLVHRVGVLGKDSGRVQVPFAAVAPPAESTWSRDSSRELSIPIGRSGATKVQQLGLGRGTAQHALIAGRTGSGKSTLLHAIITSACLWYSPDQLELYLVDFKKGVEFKTYAANHLPHARVIAVESEREFGLSVLRRLDEELARRGTTFRSLGVQDLAGYRESPGAVAQDPMRRVLLIVDEFQEFFVEDDKLSQEAMLLLDRLVRQGRAFGIHVVLGSQTIGGAYSLARSTIGQMAVRVALQCSEADSYLILSEDNPAARLLSRPGEAIYNDASGLIEGNSPFQVVWLPDSVRDEKLQDLRARAAALKHPLPDPVVFEGNVPPGLESCRPLAKALQSAQPAALPRIWLGEAVSIKEPTHAVFRPQSAANLLIVGRDERAAHGLLIASALALAAFGQPPQPGSAPRVTILDALSPESSERSPLQDLAAALPNWIRYVTPRGADEAISAIYEDLARRAGQDRAEPAFLFIHGLQRFRSLRRADDDFGFSSSTDAKPSRPDQQFAHILREGSVAGIHTLLWCDSNTNLERAIDRRALREFDLRVLFQMSGSDSTALVDHPQAQALGQHRALLFSEELGQFEKFRPYAPPDAATLARLVQLLLDRNAPATQSPPR